MTSNQKKLLSGLIAGVITACTGLLAVATDLPAESSITSIGTTTWVVILVGGLLQSLKDIKTYLAAPPTDSK